jgi:flagellar biosynthesis/type III secretory pathway chaperone
VKSQWLEINEATEVFNLELEYLCELVVNGELRTATEKDKLLIDVSSMPVYLDQANSTNNELFVPLNDELSVLRNECAWLKSENLKNKRIIEEYFCKFTELKGIQAELIELVNQQADTIRELRGYPGKQKRLQKQQQKQRRSNPVAMVWMCFPLFGLFLTAFIEVVKTYQISNLGDFLKLIGLV